MNANRLARQLSFVLLLCAVGTAAAQSEEPALDAVSSAKVAAESERASLADARRRAKLMHEIYTATLAVMHERYFRDERAIVPARAMEDVFQEMERTAKVSARWISVNMEPMSVNHTPKSEFEKRAAREMAGGKSEVETVEEGYYRRAGAIELEGSCVQCHMGFFKELPKTPRYVGLVISVPVAEDN